MKFQSQFSQNDSVLTPGFTDRDATPPNYFVSKKKEIDTSQEAFGQTVKVDDEEIPNF